MDLILILTLVVLCSAVTVAFSKTYLNRSRHDPGVGGLRWVLLRVRVRVRVRVWTAYTCQMTCRGVSLWHLFQLMDHNGIWP